MDWAAPSRRMLISFSKAPAEQSPFFTLLCSHELGFPGKIFRFKSRHLCQHCHSSEQFKQYPTFS